MRDSGKGAVAEAFRKAKERRSRAEANGERSEENKGDAKGWSKEDHTTFLEEAEKAQWAIGG